MSSIWQGLSRIQAETDPASPDDRLRGRTYAIPFDRVWKAAVRIANGGMVGWRLLHADDQRGVLRAERRTLLLKRFDDVVITVRLDENAQTRVDLVTRTRTGKGDLGRGPRLVSRFSGKLDRALGATPAQILDPTIAPSWSRTA